jgi:hypothetical protein
MARSQLAADREAEEVEGTVGARTGDVVTAMAVAVTQMGHRRVG